jgi:ribonuclease HII
MSYVIGIDEAGYGPNLGPLVISATIWEVPLGVRGEDLYERLQGIIAPWNGTAAKRTDDRIVIADSKLLYRCGSGLHLLERGLWPMMAVLDHRPQSWSEVWDVLAPAALPQLAAVPWYAEFDAPAPLHANHAELDKLALWLVENFRATEVWLTDILCRVVFPAELNDLLKQCGSKAAALSQVSLELLQAALARVPNQPATVLCDKHGGRNHYAGLLSQCFGKLVEVRRESRQQSVYCFGPPSARRQICFSVRAESYLPVALASMAAKYLRELAMLAFNEYWCDRVAGLLPTAGYPGDARRFKRAIADAQHALGIADHLLWRNR